MDPAHLSLLIVDDDPFALELHRHVAETAFNGSRITAISEPGDVLELCETTAFSCVLLDYDMPSLDGLELARRLRDRHPHLPVVLCTGAGDEMLVARALQGGVTDYIPKAAVRPPALRRTILNAIQSTEHARIIDDQRAELETFAFALAHDFKQPLRQITTFSRLATQDVEKGALNEAREHLTFLGDAARRLSALVDVMSQYTLLNRAVTLETLSVAAVVDDVLKSLGAYIGEREGLVTVQGDVCAVSSPVFLRQILQNLIVNGLRYNTNSQPEVVILLSREGDTATIRVKDNGIGIAPEYLDQIFKPLTRLHTEAEYTGTGLGLTLARKAALAQGGAIACASQPGVGSEFIVTLSAADARAAA